MKKVTIALIAIITLFGLFIVISIASDSDLSNIYSSIFQNSDSPKEANNRIGGSQLDDSILVGATTLAEGNFIKNNYDVTGKAMFLQQGDKIILRIEDFSIVSGPNPYVSLVSLGKYGSILIEEPIDIGPIKSGEGTINFEVPENTDIQKYNIVWIDSSSLGISLTYATLK